MFNELALRLANDGELAEIYTRALAGESLAPTEATRFTLYVTAYLTSVEALVGQQSLDLGYTDLEANSVVEFFAPTLRSMLRSPAGAQWWQERGQHLFVEPFRTRVEAALKLNVTNADAEAS